MFEALNHFNYSFNFVLDGKKGEKQKKGGDYFKRGVPFGGEISEDWDLERVERFIKALIHPPYPLATYKNTPIDDIKSYLKLKNER